MAALQPEATSLMSNLHSNGEYIGGLLICPKGLSDSFNSGKFAVHGSRERVCLNAEMKFDLRGFLKCVDMPPYTITLLITSIFGWRPGSDMHLKSPKAGNKNFVLANLE
jgi:hypothetical protein